MTDPTDRLIDALDRHGFDPRPTGPDAWESRCPGHNGSRHNLTVTRGDDGRALACCHHADESGRGCSADAITAALGLTLADLFPADPGRDGAARPAHEGNGKAKGRSYPTPEAALAATIRKLRKPTAHWSYPDAGGNEVMRVYRFDPIDPKTRKPIKEFRPVHRAVDGWRLGDPPGPLPLYHLPELADVARVYVFEGEKCADLARGLGLTATTSAHGAQSPHKTDWTPLAGKEVIIVPDHDAPGEGFARAVVGLLARLEPRPTVRVVRLPLRNEGDDIAEWLEKLPDSWGPDQAHAELERLADSAPAEDWDGANDPDPGAETTRAESGDTAGSTPPTRWVEVAPETVLICHDRDGEPPNFGRVVRDMGERARMRFREGEEHQIDKIIYKKDMTFRDGRSLRVEDGGGPGEWPPLRLAGPPDVDAFPVDVFPLPVADFIRAVSKAIGCPLDFVGLPVLIVAGAAIGRSVSLLIKQGYFAPASLYGIPVGNMSCGKSPAQEIVVKPLWMIDEALHDAYRVAKAAFDREMEAFNKAKGDAKPPMPVKPTLRSAVLEDATVEAIAPQLAVNPRGLLVARDEGSALVASFNQYKGGKGSDRQFYLSALFGKPVRVDRKGHPDEPIRVPHPFLSFIGGMTPDMLGTIREQGGRDDGFIERILFAYPDPLPRPHWTEDGIPDEAAQEWAEIVHKLRARPMEATPEGKNHPHVVKFTPEAKAAWVAWYDAHADEVNAPDFDAGQLASDGKLCDFASRFALILHLLLLASDPTRGDADPIPPVGSESVRGAIDFWSYFRSHARRVRAAIAGGSGVGGGPIVKAIVAWLRAEPRPSFSERDVKQARRWIDPDGLAKALAFLAERGVIRPASRPASNTRGGRPPAPVYEVNPEFFDPQNTQNPRNSSPTGDEDRPFESFEGSEYEGDGPSDQSPDPTSDDGGAEWTY